MAKIDEMRRSTTLGGRPGAFPPGTDPAQAVGRPARLEGVRGDRSSAWIAVDRIERDPDQPREEFDEESLGRLAESLKSRGQLQPVRVRWVEERCVYVLIAGERRWRAAQRAGLKELQAVIHEGELAPEDRLGLQLQAKRIGTGQALPADQDRELGAVRTPDPSPAARSPSGW
jgi:hypothetical protein